MPASTVPGELPPPAPRACFGRDELIDQIIDLAEDLTPIALVGAGGIGKTSIALAVLHDHRIKQRFGVNRRFIRCEKFPASRPHLLSRLSKVIGAGIENPEDLTSLRPSLSSGEILIVLDNAESILDPEGTDAEEIYAVVEELSQFDNICLCVTSRISAVPSDCETLDVPTLSIDAARDTFHRICKKVEQSDLVDDILDQLDFHPLSITLLATVAHQNKWSTERLRREWGIQRTRMLQTMHHKSLAATIELSLASPMFQELGPDARALLEVIAFFPQGIDEDNLSWLFPIISNGADVFDKFCVLSLAYRSNSFVTMLAPLRDYLCPEDPRSSPLLCATKEQYLTRMSVDIHPGKPGYEESRWIKSEDVNVEHLLDVFTTVEKDSDGIWDSCADFMDHLCWHKGRPIILGPKIEGLADNHPSKPRCLVVLSRLVYVVGNYAENKRLLTDTLKLYRERGDDRAVARTLRDLSYTNYHVDLSDEGIRQAEEALEVFKQLGDTVEQAECLANLALLFNSNRQFDAAEEAASRAIDLFSEKGDQSLLIRPHRILGIIYESKGETEKAIHHLETALGIASFSNRDYQLFSVHISLAWLFKGGGRFDEAQTHIERAKLHAVNSTYDLGLAMALQAQLWYRRDRVEEARSEVLRAVEIFEKFGAAGMVGICGDLLYDIERETTKPVNPDDESSGYGELFVRGGINCCASQCFTFRAGHQIRTIASSTVRCKLRMNSSAPLSPSHPQLSLPCIAMPSPFLPGTLYLILVRTLTSCT